MGLKKLENEYSSHYEKSIYENTLTIKRFKRRFIDPLNKTKRTEASHVLLFLDEKEDVYVELAYFVNETEANDFLRILRRLVYKETVFKKNYKFSVASIDDIELKR